MKNINIFCAILLFPFFTTAQAPTVSEAENLIIGTWYRDFSTYSEPQEIIPIDTSNKIVYDQNYAYYYENGILVDQCWYEIRITDCNGATSLYEIYLVTPDSTTNEEICTPIENITGDNLVLFTEGTARIVRYVKQ